MGEKGYLLEHFGNVYIGENIKTVLDSTRAVIGYGILNRDGTSFFMREMEFTLAFEPSKNRLYLCTKEEVIPIDLEDYRYSALRKIFNFGYRLEGEYKVAKQLRLKAPAGLRIKNGGIEEALDSIRHVELS